MNDSMTVALVTGASRGIGQAIALNLGNRGFTVVGTATSESGAANISAYLAEHSIRVRGCVSTCPRMSLSRPSWRILL